MTPAEINEVRHLAAGYAIERAAPFEDVTGLASALVRRYLLAFEDSIDDYAASWNASREDPGGRAWPEWAALSVDAQARYIGLEIAQCAVARPSASRAAKATSTTSCPRSGRSTTRREPCLASPHSTRRMLPGSMGGG